MQQDYGGNYLEGTAPAEKTATFVYKDEKSSNFQHSYFFFIKYVTCLLFFNSFYIVNFEIPYKSKSDVDQRS